MSGFWRRANLPFKDFRLTVDGGLTRKLLEHLGGTSKSVTRLADRDVQDELLDAELPHGVLGLLGLQFIVLELIVDMQKWAASPTMAAVMLSKSGDWANSARGLQDQRFWKK